MVKALLQKKISIKKWQRRIIHMENKLINTGQNSIMDNFIETDDILKDMRQIIESSQKAAHQAVNMTLVQRNWMMGYRIASEELHGEKRAEYGAKIIKKFLQFASLFFFFLLCLPLRLLLLPYYHHNAYMNYLYHILLNCIIFLEVLQLLCQLLSFFAKFIFLIFSKYRFDF